jgi:hypothetical protein
LLLGLLGICKGDEVMKKIFVIMLLSLVICSLFSCANTRYIEKEIIVTEIIEVDREVVVTELVEIEVEKEIIVTELVEVPVISEVIVTEIVEVPVISEVYVEKVVVETIEIPTPIDLNLHTLDSASLQTFIKHKGVAGEVSYYDLDNVLIYLIEASSSGDICFYILDDEAIASNGNIYELDLTLFKIRRESSAGNGRVNSNAARGVYVVNGSIKKTISSNYFPEGTVTFVNLNILSLENYLSNYYGVS